MTTLTIELTNGKALKLLQDLEDLNLIRVIKKPIQLSSLRDKIKTKMTSEAIDKQVSELRDEWQRAI
ncbi:hypothetical protein [Mucilaginibacter paludis]|uniref:Uncharacterized protein n=1 Tax=Mucilaginibacter paludis DSM 18603 TaxID=714943 RepID=H1Y1V1_9SPHI|nr:hypothetical protein [Mucilaginibacter paludis]EHQ25654.1 hypothetical protein Mucpa_1496 [Mucilaginibacter paludis DSM 18603]